MAGGIWLSQNKTRPGAYINFKAVPKSAMTVGDRGVVAIGLPLSWGAQGELIEVLSADLVDGNSLKSVGFTAFTKTDAVNKLLIGALSYSYKALVYRLDKGGQKAGATIGNLTATAKFTGKFGNNIIIAISKDVSTGLSNVITYVEGTTKDSQKVSDISELESNDFVDFSGSGDFEETSGEALSGGSDGQVTDSAVYPEMFSLLKMARWQTYAYTGTDESIKSNVVSFIKQMRDDEGRYVQGVVSDYSGADYEGIINSACGVVIDGVNFSKNEFTAIVAGLTAGANFNESNTGKKIAGATRIIGEMNDTEIKKALADGKFVISTSTKGEIKVEQDINSLHTFTLEKNYNFSKNRVLRTLDEIGTSTKITWEDTYMGKVDNNDDGRGLFKSDLVVYGNELQRLAGIQNFAGPNDITVEQGNDLDAVLVTWAVQPVDSMEKLYMTVNVKS